MTTDDSPQACSGCGRRADDAAWAWSRSVDERGRVTWQCQTCVRDHTRDIEAKLPDDWWE